MTMTELDVVEAPITEGEAGALLTGFIGGMLIVAAFAALC